MGSIQSRQAAIGYKTANQRPSCRNCKHGAEVFIPLNAATEEKKPAAEKPVETAKPAEPAKAAEPEKKKGFVCGVCGYVLESDMLPPDFVCPVCQHTAEVFTPIE